VCKVYNHEWPIKVRNYLLSILNSNVINILVATNQIFEDSTQKVKFKKNLRDINNIIGFHIQPLEEYYDILPRYLNKKRVIPCVISFLNANDDSREILFNILGQQKQNTFKSNIQELPIKREDIETFKYRVSDVAGGITRKQIASMKSLDLKRQLIKSKALKDYFEEHNEEKSLIVKDINELSQRLSHYAVKMEGNVPDYLIPESIKTKMGIDEGQHYKKVVKQMINPEFEKSLAKRLAHNQLSMDDVKKKIKISNDQFITINEDREDPLETDAARLPVLSNRKLWKIKHKKSLTKVNKRLQKKGIFE